MIDFISTYIESSTPIGTGPIINSDQMDADAMNLNLSLQQLPSL